MYTSTKSPGDCSSDELAEFEELVAKGGEVSRRGLKQRIRNAYRLVFVNDGNLIGVGALKRPSPNYRNRVFKNANASSQLVGTSLELGWMFVLQNQQGKGVGRALMDALVGELNGEQCFATTRTDNQRMHLLLPRYGFVRIGSDYKSGEGEYCLCLYTINQAQNT